LREAQSSSGLILIHCPTATGFGRFNNNVRGGGRKDPQLGYLPPPSVHPAQTSLLLRKLRLGRHNADHHPARLIVAGRSCFAWSSRAFTHCRWRQHPTGFNLPRLAEVVADRSGALQAETLIRGGVASGVGEAEDFSLDPRLLTWPRTSS